MKRQSDVEKTACSAKSEHARGMIRNGISALRNIEGCQAVMNLLHEEFQDLKNEQRSIAHKAMFETGKAVGFTGGRAYALFLHDGGRNE